MPNIKPATSDVSLTKKAEEWNECAARLLSGVPEGLRSNTGWDKPVDFKSLQMSKVDMETWCETVGISCDDKWSKEQLSKELLHQYLGPDLPAGGVRICHPGLAIGYDVELRNPAWSAYRLNPTEQRLTSNKRKGFTLDPALSAAKIEQTAEKLYSHSGFDRGHLAPSLAMSFQREALEAVDRSPWLSSYFCSNIAPQHPEINERSWQILEGALHEYASAPERDDRNIYVTTGLGYWNRNKTRKWDGGSECWLECPCGDSCKCRTCTDSYITVPSFYWTVACKSGVGSVGFVAENYPESAKPEGGQEGWPSSLFKYYHAQNIEKLFDLKLNLEQACYQSSMFLLNWNQGYPEPAVPTSFMIEVSSSATNSVSVNEQVWLQFTLPFGKFADYYGALLIQPPQSSKNWWNPWQATSWTVDCNSLFVHALPAVSSCLQDSDGILLDFGKPIKGGTFVFKMEFKAPSSAPSKDSVWIAEMKSPPARVDKVPPRLTHGSLLMIADMSSGHSWLVDLSFITASLLVIFVLSCLLRRRTRERDQLKAALDAHQQQPRSSSIRSNNLPLPKAAFPQQQPHWASQAPRVNKVDVELSRR